MLLCDGTVFTPVVRSQDTLWTELPLKHVFVGVLRPSHSLRAGILNTPFPLSIGPTEREIHVSTGLIKSTWLLLHLSIEKRK